MNQRDSVSLRQAGKRVRQKSGEPSAESWREAFELLRGEGESGCESAPLTQTSETVQIVSTEKSVVSAVDCPSPPTPLPGVPGRGENLPASTALPGSSGAEHLIPERKLLTRVREQMRVEHYAIRTEEAYVGWMIRYYEFHGKRAPASMGAPEINAFLTHLAAEQDVSASTQNQALSALLYLYCKVLGRELPVLNAMRAPEKERLPVVLSLVEVRQVLQNTVGFTRSFSFRKNGPAFCV